MTSRSGNFAAKNNNTRTVRVRTNAIFQSYLIGGRWLLVWVGTVYVAGPIRLRFVQQRNVIRGRRFQTVSHLPPPLRVRLLSHLVITFQENFTGHFRRKRQCNGVVDEAFSFHSRWISSPRLWEG